MTELTIEDSIKNELSGDFERLMLAVGKNDSKRLLFGHHGKWQVVCLVKGPLLGFYTVQCIRSVPMFFAKRLYKSMKVTVPFSLVPTCVYRYLNNTALRHNVVFLSDGLLTNSQLPHYPHPFSLPLPGSRHGRQHPNQDHDFPLWNRHVGHPRVFPFKIREVPL